jgi:Zn-dependent protease with chaperone function
MELALLPPIEALPAVGLALDGMVLGRRIEIKAGQILPLVWVPDDRIPPEHRAFVIHHADRAAQLAGLEGTVHVRWYEPAIGAADFGFPAERDGEIPAGMSPDLPMTIGLLASLRGELVPAVIAHEVRHLAQNHVRDLLNSETFIEDDANRFARAYLAEMGR